MSSTVQFQGGKLTPSSSTSAVSDDVSSQNRLIIMDRIHGTKYLVDTGADISVIPYTERGNPRVSQDLKLFAANGSTIDTYGVVIRNLDFGLRRAFKWEFCLANVNRPILGADFLRFYGLLVDLKNRRLVDATTSLFSIASISLDNTPSITAVLVNNEFSKILKDFPNLTSLSRLRQQKPHQVQHHILTKGSPVAERARRLPPDKFKAAKAEFDFLVEQGICRPSASAWASPLHLVRKSSGDRAAIIVV